MESSPSKRRKLTPPPAPNTAPSSPSRIPAPRDMSENATSRPSFASPTRASIARHHPELLTRSRSAGPENPRSSNIENEPPRQSLFVTPSQKKDGEPALADSKNPKSTVVEVDKESQVELEAAVSRRSTPRGKARRTAIGSMTIPPRRRSRTPGKEKSRTVDQVEKVVRSAKTKETEQMPSEKVLTPIAFRTAGLRRSPVPVQRVEPIQLSTRQEPEEPELPLTPIQRGLADPIVTTPPSGIHNTPSKRSKRAGAAKAKGSPLKPQPVVEVDKDLLEESDSERPGKRRKASELATRQLVPFDPLAEKKKLRDQLLREVQDLQADIALAEQENDRQRRYHFSKKGPAEPLNPDEIIKLLVRSAAESAPKAPQPKPTSIFKSIRSFLPFAPRPRHKPLIPLKDHPLPSHLPLIPDDPLPQLQLFTPLTYTSTITLLPSRPPSTTTTAATASTANPPPIYQTHNINISAPSGLFSARLTMTVDTSRLSIISLSLPSLSPAAEPELGRWARDRASAKSVLGRDISAVGWAMARWYEVALRRARFWSQIEAELGTEEGRSRTVARFRALGRRKRRAGDAGSAAAREGEDVPEDDELENAAASNKRSKFSRKQLLSNMGRTTYVLSAQGVDLRIEWAIVFDWTGEAESCLSASARIPLIWQLSDERHSLEKVPEAFDRLVRVRGPMGAVRGVVALLMGGIE